MNTMSNSIKQSTIAVLLCSTLLISRMDLSYVKTYLKEVVVKTLKTIETRKVITEYKEQTCVGSLPDEAGLAIRSLVNLNMSSYVFSNVTDMKQPMESFHMSSDMRCRGSPIIRAP